jgi:serine/threonine protein kinase
MNDHALLRCHGRRKMPHVSLHMLGAGDQVGSYVIRRRLGAGGMGEVYLADHRNIDRQAAIKVLLPEHSTNRDIIARFLAEARAASRIKHPGIVEIIDCERDSDGRVYIVMEFLNGESLGASLQRISTFDLGSALAIGGQIADALSAAHSKGIIHRDLKPDNVFLAAASGPGVDAPIAVKILDFGIAKLTGDSAGEAGRTRTGNIIGTPRYMSPEQCRGAGAIDYRTDVYSLGCILFEMLVGRPPFVRAGAGDLIAAHISEAPPEITSIQPSIPPDLGRLVMGMLAKDPDARPKSMQEIVLDIERILRVPAGEFSRLVLPPEGFPFAAAPRESTESSYLEDGDLPSVQSLAGATRALPRNLTTFGQTASERVIFPRPAPRRVTMRLVIVVPSAIAAIATVVYLVHRPRSEPTPTPTTIGLVRDAVTASVAGEGAQPAPLAALPRSSPPAAARVVIRIESRPAGAEVWLAGEPVASGRTPCDVAFPGKEDRRDVTLKAPGYREKRLAIDVSADAAVKVDLDRLPTDHPRKQPKRPSYRRGHD